MDSEFITLRGKVIINTQRMIVQNLKPDMRQTIVGEITKPLIVLAAAFFSFFLPSKAFGYLGTIIFLSFFFLNHFKQLYLILFRKSYSDFIPLNRIVSFELKPDEFGLESEVRLHLQNGRYRSLVFRTLEHQYESFTEYLSQHVVQGQLA